MKVDIAGQSPPYGTINVHLGDNLGVLQTFEEKSFDLVYIDPPFNTGRTQTLTRQKTENGTVSSVGPTASYGDSVPDLPAFLKPRMERTHDLLSSVGSLFFHIDWREVHYCKVLLDMIFGRDCFMNEIIWAYDYGGRSKKKWSSKHDSILWYVKDKRRYTFNFEEMDRIPYMAPGLVGPEKAARGKTPTDVWWHTIVPTNGKERTGYPTQKPLGILNRIIKVHTRPGDQVLDFFAGSGTTGEACALLGRNSVLVDQNPQAMDVMARRLERFSPVFHKQDTPRSTQGR